MTQSTRLRELDEQLRDVFSQSGLADDATYRAKDSTTDVSCTVFVDRGVTYQGADGQVMNDQIVITAFLEEITGVPARGAEFDIGDETFRVDRVTNKDESRVVCLVTVKP